MHLSALRDAHQWDLQIINKWGSDVIYLLYSVVSVPETHRGPSWRPRTISSRNTF